MIEVQATGEGCFGGRGVVERGGRSLSGGCEFIDDDPETAPSKRIERHHPAYKKGKSNLAHAPIILDRTGLNRVRAACPHFDSWVSRVESLTD